MSTAPPPTVAYLGSGGTMGSGMVANLLAAGFAVRAWNRTPDRPRHREVVAAGATEARSIAEAVGPATLVAVCVGGPADVEEVLLGEGGAASVAAPGTLVVDLSTISPEAARSIGARLGERGLRYLDAPVSGGDVGARAGTLTVMVGGAAADVEEARPVLEAVGSTIRHCGPSGAGQTIKAVNQLLAAATTLATAEGLVLAESQGLDPSLVIEVCGSGAAGSWSLTHLGPRVVEGDYASGFKTRHLLKDLGFVASLVEGAGLDLPQLRVALERFAAAGERDDGAGAELGTHAVVETYRDS